METCKFCNRLATRNYQKVWIMWTLDSEGKYSKQAKQKFDIQEPIEDDNVHTCDDCGVAFENGVLG